MQRVFFEKYVLNSSFDKRCSSKICRWIWEIRSS